LSTISDASGITRPTGRAELDIVRRRAVRESCAFIGSSDGWLEEIFDRPTIMGCLQAAPAHADRAERRPRRGRNTVAARTASAAPPYPKRRARRKRASVIKSRTPASIFGVLLTFTQAARQRAAGLTPGRPAGSHLSPPIRGGVSNSDSGNNNNGAGRILRQWSQ
jgi:hypothetical protein